MSRVGDLLTGVLAPGAVAGIDGVFSALFLKGRSIGGIIPDVTIREQATDRVVATRHPVEQGADITDHAYKEVAEVVMEIAWSNSSLFLRSIVSGSIFSGQISDVNDLYASVLDLQASRQLFDLVTGKRTYSNMLLLLVENETNAEKENSLHLVLHMQQQIVVSTTSASFLQPQDQADPTATGSTQNSGTKQPALAPNQSALSVLFGG